MDKSRFRAKTKRGSTEKPIFYGGLWGDDEPETKEAEQILTKADVKFGKVSLQKNPQPGAFFVAPTFVAPEGTFRGLEAIEAYLGWFVYDKRYHKYALERAGVT